MDGSFEGTHDRVFVGLSPASELNSCERIKANDIVYCVWEYYSNATNHVAPTQPGPGGRVTQSSAGRPTPPSLQTQDKLLKLIEKSCKDASGVTAVTATTLPYSNKISEFSR